MNKDGSKAVTVPKRKKYYTKTGAVDERKLTLLDVVMAPDIPQGGKDEKYFVDRCETLSIRALVESGAAEYILQRPNHPAFVRILEFVTERSRGKVPDVIKQEHTITPAVALPAKQPEQIPYVPFEVLPNATVPQEAGGN